MREVKQHRNTNLVSVRKKKEGNKKKATRDQRTSQSQNVKLMSSRMKSTERQGRKRTIDVLNGTRICLIIKHVFINKWNCKRFEWLHSWSWTDEDRKSLTETVIKDYIGRTEFVRDVMCATIFEAERIRFGSIELLMSCNLRCKVGLRRRAIARGRMKCSTCALVEHMGHRAHVSLTWHDVTEEMRLRRWNIWKMFLKYI